SASTSPSPNPVTSATITTLTISPSTGTGCGRSPLPTVSDSTISLPIPATDGAPAPVTGHTASTGQPDAHPERGTGPTPFRLPDPAPEAALAERMGIRFDNPLLLRQALTHRSVLHDWQQVEDIPAILQSNERLEFLGDAVLGAIAAEYLYHHDPGADEGQLTRHRVAAVRAETLVQWARELAVDEALYLGTGEQVSHSTRDRMLAGAFEALVGAVHVDRGRDAAERFVLGFLERDLDAILQQEAVANPKGRLQEVLQERER